MKILTLDDEPKALLVLTRAVTAAVPGAELLQTTDPDEALRMAEAERPEVAFLDICIGDRSGLDVARQLKRQNPRINIIFVSGYSEYTMEAISLHSSGYVLKPVIPEDIQQEMNNLLFPADANAEPAAVQEHTGVYAHTFGNFELFAEGVPVQFHLAKAKEMLAYLIDRDGAAVTRKELASILFESGEYTRKTQNYLSKIYKDLKESLEQAGITELLCKGYNQYYVDQTKFESDVRDYRRGVPGAINRFAGEYMTQYYWAEDTLGSLYNEFHTYH